jgi:Flp pilus assembly protein TadG
MVNSSLSGPTQEPAVPDATSRRRCGDRRRPGCSLVEMAFATPFLLLLMLGTIDLGRMFFDYIQLRGAVIEGATYGGRNPSDSGGIAAQVTNNGVPAGTAIMIVTQAGCFTKGGIGNITVTAGSTFTPITTGFLQAYWNIGSVNLSASSTMRCLT